MNSAITSNKVCFSFICGTVSRKAWKRVRRGNLKEGIVRLWENISLHQVFHGRTSQWFMGFIKIFCHSLYWSWRNGTLVIYTPWWSIWIIYFLYNVYSYMPTQPDDYSSNSIRARLLFPLLYLHNQGFIWSSCNHYNPWNHWTRILFILISWANKSLQYLNLNVYL